ncbi:MAG: ABC transporter ATP-binding protein [Myxococcaceae bacterium]
MSSQLAIDARGLSKTYRVGFFMNRRVIALQQMDLSVEAGKIYGLLGPNGAGKSTTIKILMNLVRQDSGTASLFGQPVSHAATRKSVGFLPENPAPYEYLTGLEFVRLAGRLAGLSGRDLDARAKQVLGLVEMSHAAKLQIRRYSKGMVQRVALAQALVGQPKLLILDEPTSGLDPIGRRQMRDLIEEQRRNGATVLFCSHIIPDVEAMCDRVAILVAGKRVKEGTIHELVAQDDSASALTVEAIDEPRLRALLRPDAPLTREGDHRFTVRIPSQDASALAAAVITGGGRVVQLVPARHTLEELFMSAVDSAARTSSVGGEIFT